MAICGTVEISSKEHKEILKNGDMVSCEAKVPHSLKAKQQSVISLILSKNDDTKKVENLIMLK